MLLICLQSDKMSPLSNITTKTISFVCSQYQIHLCKLKNDNKRTSTENFTLNQSVHLFVTFSVCCFSTLFRGGVSYKNGCRND